MMIITAKDFENNLELFSGRQFDEHLKLYHGYIDKTNAISVAGRHDGSLEYVGLKMNETYNLDGVLLHELFFENIHPTLLGAPVGSSEAERKFEEFIIHWFSDIKFWTNEFRQAALLARGWVIFGWDRRTNTYRNIVLNLHNEGLVTGFVPFIVLDVYEHAYWMDYGTNKAGYIEAFLANLNYKVIEQRFEEG